MQHELILGGARSGKSRCAEQRAVAWLAAAPGRSATLVATALPGDADMAERIARHRSDRAVRAPGLATVEEPVALAGAITQQSAPGRLLVVDCLTLWLTNLTMPLHPPATGQSSSTAFDVDAQVDALLHSLRTAPGPVVLVSNEIGMGVMPLSREARLFVDTLGHLHQRVQQACARVTLMVAGCELTVKAPARTTGEPTR